MEISKCYRSRCATSVSFPTYKVGFIGLWLNYTKTWEALVQYQTHSKCVTVTTFCFFSLLLLQIELHRLHVDLDHIWGKDSQIEPLNQGRCIGLRGQFVPTK
jgi:hypothetical protein